MAIVVIAIPGSLRAGLELFLGLPTARLASIDTRRYTGNRCIVPWTARRCLPISCLLAHDEAVHYLRGQ